MDTQTEPVGPLFPVTELPGRPWMPRRGGKKVSTSSVWRAVLKGRGGVVMPTMKIAGQRYTTDQWAQEYFRATSAVTPPAAQTHQSPSKRQRDVARAARELEESGF